VSSFAENDKKGPSIQQINDDYILYLFTDRQQQQQNVYNYKQPNVFVLVLYAMQQQQEESLKNK
jgi:hypothetical protein